MYFGTILFPWANRSLNITANSKQSARCIYFVWLWFDGCHVTQKLVLQISTATVTNKRWIIHSSDRSNPKPLPICRFHSLLLQVRPEWSDHRSCWLSHGPTEWFIHSASVVRSCDCLGCILSTSIFGALNTASSGSELLERNVNFTSQLPPCAQSSQEELMWGKPESFLSITKSNINSQITLDKRNRTKPGGSKPFTVALLKEILFAFAPD